MKAVRIVLVLLVVAVAGFLVWNAGRAIEPPSAVLPKPADPAGTPTRSPIGDLADGTSAPPAEGDGGATPKPPARSPIEDLAGGPSARPAEGEAGATPKAKPKPPRTEPVLRAPEGTAVAAGASVDVVVPYRKGTKSRYRVVSAEGQRDRETDAVQFAEVTWFLATEVVKGDGTGPARVRVQLDALRYRTVLNDRPVDFDSRHPDPALLADPVFARVVKPTMATFGIPVELQLDRGGGIVAVEGADALRRAFLDEVDKFGAREARLARDAPSEQALVERWGEALFPPLGGGTVVAGTPREMTLRMGVYETWAITFPGRCDVTHDDPAAFRVEMRATPSIEEVGGTATTPEGIALEKLHVQSDRDAYRGAWRFDRTTGRLLHADISLKLQLWAAFRAGTDAQGETDYDRRFADMERVVTVDLVDD